MHVPPLYRVYPMSTREKSSICKGLRARSLPKTGIFSQIVYPNVYLA